jgi:hypothetical protein
MVGSVSVGIVNPQPLGQTPFFVLRNNDPAVDGVFVSTNVDIPRGVAVAISGITQQHYVDFLRTFTNGTAFPSLNILECQGDYAFENLSVFNWTIGINENQVGAQFDYQSFSIHAIPEPGSLLVFGVALLVGATRRRRATT